MNPGIVASLIGQKCWYVSGGGATSPSFVLVCGEKVARDSPLKNPAHPSDYRENRGSYELLVWCSWRLQTDCTVLATSDGGDWGVKALDVLVMAEVANASCIAPAWDIVLTFSNGLTLSVFADNHGPEPSASQNWELWIPKTYVKAGPGEIWEEEAL